MPSVLIQIRNLENVEAARSIAEASGATCGGDKLIPRLTQLMTCATTATCGRRCLSKTLTAEYGTWSWNR